MNDKELYDYYILASLFSLLGGVIHEHENLKGVANGLFEAICAKYGKTPQQVSDFLEVNDLMEG